MTADHGSAGELEVSAQDGSVPRGDATGCVIVGAGPAGLVLGLLLARCGVQVTVLEKHGDFLHDFRGDTVHPVTMDLLDDLGLGTQFAQLPQTHVRDVVLPDRRGRQRRVVDFDVLRRVGVAHPYLALVPQWDLLNLLATAAAAEPGFRLVLDAEATGPLRQDGQPNGQVTGVTYRDRRTGTTHQLQARLTVACDGRDSVLRRAAGLQTKAVEVPFDTWWFRLSHPSDRLAPDSKSNPKSEQFGSGQPGPGGPREAVRRWAGRGRFAVVVPRQGYDQVGYVTAKGSDSRLRERGVEAFRADVAELMPQHADRVEQITSMEEVKLLHVRLDRLRRWHTDGLLCLGDAAHAMSPMGGLGIGLAIQDAVAAARLLAAARPAALFAARGDSTTGACTTGAGTREGIGVVPGDVLARIRRRRAVPAALAQGVQRLLHADLARTLDRGGAAGAMGMPLSLLRWVPGARLAAAYLIGVGLRPETAPPAARRPRSELVDQTVQDGVQTLEDATPAVNDHDDDHDQDQDGTGPRISTRNATGAGRGA